MSQEEIIKQRERLNEGLRQSYEKMLLYKMKLGQEVVTSDGNGKPVIMSAEEAWQQYQSHYITHPTTDNAAISEPPTKG